MFFLFSFIPNFKIGPIFSKLSYVPQRRTTSCISWTKNVLYVLETKKCLDTSWTGIFFSPSPPSRGICTSPALQMHQRNLKLGNPQISKISKREAAGGEIKRNCRNVSSFPPLQCIDLTGWAAAGGINMKAASLLNLKNVQFTSLSGNPETKIEKVEEYVFKSRLFFEFVTTRLLHRYIQKPLENKLLIVKARIK